MMFLQVHNKFGALPGGNNGISILLFFAWCAISASLVLFSLNFLFRGSGSSFFFAVSTLSNSEVDKPRNRANCDKSMKIGESTKFDMLSKIGYRPLLKYGPLCYF